MAALGTAAADLNASIITKDEDFAVRRVLQKAGPSVVWIRLGNTGKRQMLHWFGHDAAIDPGRTGTG